MKAVEEGKVYVDATFECASCGRPAWVIVTSLQVGDEKVKLDPPIYLCGRCADLDTIKPPERN